jgi:Zn-finger nucleic acid-binding protein
VATDEATGVYLPGCNVIKFFDVREGARFEVCYRCGGVIVWDDEGANREDHIAWHKAIEVAHHEATRR